MAESTEQLTAAKEEIKDQTSSGVDSLKGNFAQLRDEVAKLIGSALDAGKEGAGKFKDSGSESMDQLGQKIGERPLMSAMIALGLGAALATLLMTARKRDA